MISCDNLVTVPVAQLDPAPVGSLDELKRSRAGPRPPLALDIVY